MGKLGKISFIQISNNDKSINQMFQVPGTLYLSITLLHPWTQ